MARRRAGLAVAIALLVAVAAVLAGCGSDDDGSRTGPGGRPTARPAPARTLAELQPDRIIRRVEQLRGLRLKRRPRFRVISASEAQRYIARQASRDSGGASARDERISDDLGKLLGLLPPDADIEQLSQRLAGDAFLGFYDGDRNEMTIIRHGSGLPIGVEATVAHELVHAIDDQHFGIFRHLQRERDDDAALAFSSVVEGNATEIEQRYAKRYRVAEQDPADAARAKRLIKDVPFGILLQLSFPYALGQVFVQTLDARPDGQRLLARALGSDPPRASVGILDPDWYLSGQRPRRVALDARRVLGRGWTPLQDDTIGAADVLGLLSHSEGESVTAAGPARSWRGGRFSYLRRGGSAPCRAPCVTRDAFVGSLRFTSPATAQLFTALLGQSIVRHRDGRSVSDGVWRIHDRGGAGGSGAAAGTDGAVATFAYAPTPALAQRLVREAP